MKLSSRIERSHLSPIRKFYPYQVECNKKGIKIYHLNIGQPDIQTPPVYFDAIRDFSQPVLAYAPSPGIPQLIQAVQAYYAGIGVAYETGDILVTTGGSEALQIALSCILDADDEILIPEPFYPNYNTMAYTCGAKIHPIPTSPHDGYHYADRAKVEAEINEHTRAIMVTNPGNPTGAVLTPEEMRMMVDIAKELTRIAAERKKAEENLQRIEAKLANESFTSRAPENVVNAEREKAEKARALIAKLDESAAAMQI